MPVMVQNEQAGPTVLSSDPKGTHYVEWQGKGDVNGHDIQQVPDEVYNTVAFQRCVRLGVLSLLNDDSFESITEAQDRQRAAWERRNSSMADDAEGTIDRQANQDIVSLPCVGPSHQPGKRCGADVPVKDLKKDEVPPLCNQHVTLASEFTPSHEVVDGRNTVVWTRFSMGPRETYRS